MPALHGLTAQQRPRHSIHHGWASNERFADTPDAGKLGVLMRADIYAARRSLEPNSQGYLCCQGETDVCVAKVLSRSCVDRGPLEIWFEAVVGLRMMVLADVDK